MAARGNYSSNNSSHHAHHTLYALPESQEPVTLPRKRRPRAVGEVSVTCPASSVYLNSAAEHNPGQTSPEPEPIYQNETVAELSKQRQREDQQRQRGELRRQHLSVLRICHEEPQAAEAGAAHRVSMVVSTFVGSLQLGGRNRREFPDHLQIN